MNNTLKYFMILLLGTFITILSYIMGYLRFGSNNLYNLISIIFLYITVYPLFSKSFNKSLFVFLIMLPFWIYYSSYQIFNVKIMGINMEYQFLYTALWYIGTRKCNNYINIKLFRFIEIFILFVTSSLIISLPNTFKPFISITGYVYGILLPFMILLIMIKSLSIEKLNQTKLVIIISTVIHLIFSIFLEYSGQNFFTIINPYGRLTGIFGNTLYITLISLYSLPLILSLFRVNTSLQKKILTYLALIVVMISIVLTASRGGVLIALIIILYYALLNINPIDVLKNTCSIFILLFISFVILQQVFPKVIVAFQDRITLIGIGDTNRIAFLENTAKLIISNFEYFIISGFGIANFQFFYNSITDTVVTSAHNFFINIVVELGLIVVIIYLSMLMFTFLQKCFSGYKYYKVQLFVLILYSVVIGSSIAAITVNNDFLLVNNMYSLMLFITFGAIVITTRKSAKLH